MLSLSKVIPEHTMTENFRWVSREFMLFSKYVNVRKKCNLSIDNTCFWCKKKFEDSEMMALAAREKKENVLLCQKCVDKMEEKEVI